VNKRGSQEQLGKPPPTNKRRFTVNLSRFQLALPLPHEERIIDVLGHVPLLKQVPLEDLKRIASIAKCAKYEDNENIMSYGCPSDTLHMILEGTGKVCIPHQIGTLSSNDFFGEKALALASSTNEIQVSASGGPVTTISIAAADFQQLGIKTALLRAGRAIKAPQQTNKAVPEHTAGNGHVKDGVCQESGRRIVKEYTQTLSDRQVITTAVKNNRMLGEALQVSEQQCNLIADSVYLICLEQDEVLFRKGDTTGNAYYIIQDGVVEVNVSDDLHSSVRLLAGDSFGEVSLLYSTPRNATIVARRSTYLWVLNRADFKNVAALSYKGRIEDYASLICKIPCLSSLMNVTNWDMVANVLEEFVVDEGDDICTQDEDEGMLFIIFDGECEVIKDGEVQQTLTRGDWVGEEALMQNVPVNVTVRATSDVVTVLSLECNSFRTIVQAVMAIEKQKPSSESGNQWCPLNNKFIDKEKMTDEFLKKSMWKSLRHHVKTMQTQHSIHRTTRIGTLGEGSFGSVVLLRDDSTDKLYALKALDKEHIEAEKMGKSVQNERTVQGMIDSDFVVRLYVTYQDQTNIFFMMEPVMGGELFDVYSEQKLFGRLDVARFYIACVTLGLQALHAKRVIYRDLKLENCLLSEDGYVKLTDMGIAKIVIGKTYTVCGTADYFAPETLRQQGHNRAVDWWACGVVLFVMVTGRSPFDAPEVTEIYKNIMKGFSKVKFPDSVPSDVTDVIKSLCRKKPEERITMQKTGVEGLKEMGYFMGLEWNELERKALDAPYKPDPPDMEKIAKKKLTRDINLEVENISIWDGSLPEEYKVSDV
jgi:CRP-like cAMP-binding protein